MIIKNALVQMAFGNYIHDVSFIGRQAAWELGQTMKVRAIKLAIRAEIKQKFAAMMQERFPNLRPFTSADLLP